MEPNRRFIPAYAGNSRFQENLASMFTVHPRLRGELPAPIAAVAVMDGSSPLTRGTQTIVFRVLRRVRFIPAYAGNSQDNRRGRKLAPGSSPLTRGTRPLSYYPRKTKTVHPRLRGELLSEPLLKTAWFGSSPLTRGTHLKTV